MGSLPLLLFLMACIIYFVLNDVQPSWMDPLPPPTSTSTEDCNNHKRESSPTIDQLWVGDVAGNGNKQPISLFMSFCQANIGWLDTYLVGHTINSTTVLSKCGNPLPFDEEMLEEIKHVTLPNVGRNDHTIAHTMSLIAQNPSAYQNHIIVFLKDNLKLHQQAKPRSLTNMIRTASVNGFGCFLKPRDGISHYHDTSVLKSFNISKYREDVKTNDNTNFKSPYANLGAWLDKIGISLPSPFTTVCYGGSFAVKASRIAAIPHTTWEAIETTLTRADTVEEGHFAERSWSGLLSYPPTAEVNKQLRKKYSGINFALSKDGGGQLGALLL